MNNLIDALSSFSLAELKQEINRREILKRMELINITFRVVCKYYNTTEKSVMYKGKKGFAKGTGPIRNAKRALFYIFHYYHKKTAEETGKIMDKSHSTCTVSANKVKGEMEVSLKFKEEIEFLIKCIENEIQRA